MKKNYFLNNIYLYFSLLLFFGLSQSLQAGNAYSYEFDGSSQSIYLTGASDLNVTNNWTFEAWINVDGVSGWDDFMFRDGIFSFQVKNPLGSGDFAIDFYNRDNAEQLTSDDTQDFDFDTWYHIAATFDGTTAYLYVNGNLIDSDNTAANWILTETTNHLNIGARYLGGYGSYFDGEVDEIRISNIARSIDDMQTDYSREEYTLDANTLLLMHFNDQSSPPTYETETGYAGTVTNHNTSTTNYVFASIAADKLLRPDYQSKVTGNWSNHASWQYYDGTTTSYEDATLSPNSYDNIITIITGHTIIIDDDLSFNQTYINTGSNVTIADTVSATLSNGDSTDLEVAGIFRKDGVLLLAGSPLIDVLNGGIYQHNSDASISTATWNSGATCEVIGVGTGTTFLELGNLGQAFHNFTWNSSTQLRNVGLQGLTTIAGDFTMQNSNSYDVRLVTSSTDKTLGITGNFILIGGNLELTNANGACFFVCYGNYTQTSGDILGQGGAGTGIGYLRFGPIDESGIHSGTFIHSGGIFEPTNIQINSSYTLTLSTDMNIGAAPVTLNGHLTVPSGITLTIGSGSSLKVSSTQNFTGSLINRGTVAGDVDVECYTTPEQWHGFSTPVDNQTAAALYQGGSPDVWMKYYNEADRTYTNITDLATDLEDMKGWMVKVGGSSDFTFNLNGPLRTGTIGDPDGMIRSSGGDSIGFNFVGNPFPSAIDWDAPIGWTKSANMEDAIYVYNNGNWDTYVGGTGINDGSQYIAMNQGFFVQVHDGGTYPEYGTLQMTSEVCVHSDTGFRKSQQQLIRLQIADNELTDETVIKLTNEATQGWDGNLDAHKLFSFNEDYPQIYSTANGNMSINSLPENTGTIPLDVVGIDENLMTMSLTEFGDFSQILLYDEYVEEITDLIVHDYTFTYSNNVTDRFFISFIITDIEEELAIQERIFYAFAENNKINVVLQNSESASIAIYNLLGQEIITKTIHSTQSSFEVNSTGYYIVKVSNGVNISTQKVFLK